MRSICACIDDAGLLGYSLVMSQRSETSIPLHPRHIALVCRLARRLKRRLPPSVELGEVISDGFLGLEKAARLFEPDRRVPFEAFASVYVQGAMLDGLRVRQRQARALPSTDRVIGECVYEPRIERVADERLALPMLLSALPRRTRLVLLLHHLEGLTMRQVGDCLRITEARVSQLHARGASALREDRCCAKNNPEI
jgi:RNA polymerase sigma factor (sigma-70 family)